jgi:tetratricopeptide (TPR) repeat protein
MSHEKDHILLVLLGASEWPKAPEFTPAEAFKNSAQALKGYFLSPEKFGVPSDNILDLFDSDRSYDEMDEEMGEWIEQNLSEAITDLIVCFIGHAGFVDGHDDYFLAIRRTREDNFRASSITIKALAKTIKAKARYLRRHIILDCCYAASALDVFQSGVAQVAIEQSLEAFGTAGKGYGIPRKGTSLLCSSRHNRPSLLSPKGEYTMFTEALLYSLENGSEDYDEYFSLESLCSMARDYLKTEYDDNAPKPEVHSPDQNEGDVASVPLFPNFARQNSVPAEQNSESAGTQPAPAKQAGEVRKETTAKRKESDGTKSPASTVERSPRDVPAQAYAEGSRGDELFDERRWSEAINAFTKAIEIHRRVPVWHYKLAVAMLEANRSPEDIEKEFKTAVELEPSNLTYRLDYAQFLARRRKWAKAIPQLEKVLASDEENHEAKTQLMIAVQQHNLALEAYSEALELQESGNSLQALEAYRKVHDIETNLNDVNSRLSSLFQQVDRDKKIEKLNAEILTNPDDPKLHYQLGALYLASENLDKAEVALKRYAQLDANNPGAYSSLGHLYTAQEKWNEAEAAFSKAIELDPANPKRYIELATSVYAQMDWERASELYGKAQSLTTDPGTRIRLRALLVEVKEKARRESFAEVRQHSAQGRVLFSRSQWNEAETAFRKALELDPANPQRHLDLGALFFAQMEWDSALTFYESGLKLATDPVMSYRLKKAIKRAKELQKSAEQQESPNLAQRFKSRRMIAVISVLVLAVVILVLSLWTRGAT